MRWGGRRSGRGVSWVEEEVGRGVSWVEEVGWEEVGSGCELG